MAVRGFIFDAFPRVGHQHLGLSLPYINTGPDPSMSESTICEYYWLTGRYGQPSSCQQRVNCVPDSPNQLFQPFTPSLLLPALLPASWTSKWTLICKLDKSFECIIDANKLACGPQTIPNGALAYGWGGFQARALSVFQDWCLLFCPVIISPTNYSAVLMQFGV